MHADLKWLAQNVSEWCSDLCLSHIVKVGEKRDYISGKNVDPDGIYRSRGHSVYRAFSQSEWQAARDELNQATPWQAAEDEILMEESSLSKFWNEVDVAEVNPFTSPEEDEAWEEAEQRMNAIARDGDAYPQARQLRYQDNEGGDWIDEAARTLTPQEFRGAMRFTIGKYNRRMGKKDDLISEIEKIRDYATRWLEVEQGR
jgi:hypothetical protein